MFRSRFFWRNFLSYVLIISLTTFVVSYLLTVKTADFVESDTRESLRDKLVFLIPILQSFDSLAVDELQARIYQISSLTKTRITVVDPEGAVIIETKVADPASELENHLQRPEIQKAIEKGFGSIVRYSETVQLPMIYYVQKVETAEGPHFVRLGVPFSQLEDRLGDIRYALSVGAGFGMLVSLLIALILARRVTEPIADITRVTEAISRGNYSARLEHLPKNELGTLGEAINRLAEAVQANISQREKMDRIRREFSSNVSHELKTPLTSINGYVETLLGGAIHDEENNVRFLTIIKANIERIIALVTDLLRLSSIEASEGLVSLEPVDWSPILREVVNRHTIHFQNKNIQFEIDTPKVMPLVNGSPRAMSHIIDNLLQNAVNYTPENGRIWIRVWHDRKNVHVSVQDTGIGIAMQDQSRIFERFYRVDTARSRADGGTGLGLAIVKHLVIQIQGKIKVDSELNRGSIFTVTLPITHEKLLSAAVANPDEGSVLHPN
ncbi:MAG: ATP-binding protein [Oligoflexus sp.]